MRASKSACSFDVSVCASCGQTKKSPWLGRISAWGAIEDLAGHLAE